MSASYIQYSDGPSGVDLLFVGGNLNLLVRYAELTGVGDREFSATNGPEKMKVRLADHQKVHVTLTRRGVTTLHVLQNPKWGIMFLPLISALKKIYASDIIDHDYQGGGI